VEKTDEQLARGAMEGDPQAFGALVERLRAPLVGYVTGVLGRREDAEELAQEAFLVAWQRIRSLREPARVSAWIYRIAGRLAGKRAKALRPLPLANDPPARDRETTEDPRLISLLAAVARLSQPHRDVISRKHFAGYQGDEIARQLGVAPGTVRSRLSRAYAELRRMLAEQDGQ
jgi:RNA polymerase sigma-70 factor (ECF subfamily)